MASITLTESRIDLLLTSLEARVAHLRDRADEVQNHGLAFSLLDMADTVEGLRRDVLAQVTEPTPEVEYEVDEDRADYEAEHYAEVIAPMIAAERLAEALALLDEAIYGPEGF